MVGESFFIFEYTILTDPIATGVVITNKQSQQGKSVSAIWDTGASASVITQDVVTELGLVPTGMAEVITANGPMQTSKHTVDMYLPNGLPVKSVEVTSMPNIGGQYHALIGMDIISLGDFYISTKEGKRKVIFCVPSRGDCEKAFEYMKDNG